MKKLKTCTGYIYFQIIHLNDIFKNLQTEKKPKTTNSIYLPKQIMKRKYRTLHYLVWENFANLIRFWLFFFCKSYF